MIRGIHGLLYSSDPDATRKFFRETMNLPGSDIGDGWWIFDFKEGDLGVHPVEDPSDAGDHDVSFYCDDIRGTVEDHGYGLVTHFTAPGGITIQLYQPRYVKRGAPRRKVKSRAARKPTAKRIAKKRRR